jgi:hypothetical protein
VLTNIDTQHIINTSQQRDNKRVINMTFDYEQSMKQIRDVENSMSKHVLHFFERHQFDVRKLHIRVEHQRDDFMFYAIVTFVDKLYAHDFARLTKTCDDMCCNEREYFVNDKRYIIGDGDDSGACWMQGGTLYIWVRQFDE